MGIRRNRTFFPLVVAGIASACLILVFLSPLALRAIASVPGMNWAKLSNVGQTYGAVSALLAALALVGVALSVLFQSRESRHARLDAARARQSELVRLAMDNPLYFETQMPLMASDDQKRLMSYINLELQYWAMLWEFGDLSEAELHHHLATGLFATQIGLHYWKLFGSSRLEYIGNTRRQHDFNRLVDEVYRETATSTSIDDRIHHDITKVQQGTRWPRVIKGGIMLGIAVIGGSLIDRIVFGRAQWVRRNSNYRG